MKLFVCWLACSSFIFCFVSLFCFFVAFPFQAPTANIVNKILPTVENEEASIIGAKLGTEEYFLFLEKEIVRINSTGKIQKDSFVANEPFANEAKHEIQKHPEISFDPYNFHETRFSNDIGSTVMIASGPLRDLYGLPILQVNSKSSHRENWTLKIGNKSYYSPGLSIRLKQFQEKLSLVSSSKSLIRNLVIRKKKFYFVVCLIISMIIGGFWALISKKTNSMSYSAAALLIIISIGVIYFYLELGYGISHGSGMAKCDAIRMSEQEINILRDETIRHIKGLQENGTLSDDDALRLVSSLKTKGHLIPDCFMKNLRTGKSSSDYIGMFFVKRMKFSDLNKILTN